MKYTRGKRIWAWILTLSLFLGMIPAFVSQVEVEANALGLSSLTCSNFISNATARNYIDTMMRYYITNNSNLQSTLNSGKDVIFMFEGGSDNYWNGSDYTNSAYDTRNQAVVIVVKLDSNSNAYVHYYSENCSSIPGDPSWCVSGVAYNGSVTIYDGVYRFYRWDHTGPYAAFQLDVPNSTAGGYGYYTPSSNPNGERMGCSGINIHTRASNIAAGSDLGWAWSEGCQVIGTGDTSTNEYNAFFKAVMGVSWNPWVSYYSSPKQLYTYRSYGYGQGTDWTEGYYVVDRQLALMNAGGTLYGSGSLINLYNKTALTNITAYSTNAKNNATFDYVEANCTYYPAYCEIKCTLNGAPINSQPCSVSSTYNSATLENATSGKTYTATGLFKNHYGNYWYRITTSSGKTGYIYGGEVEYVKMLTPDVSISGYTLPNGHVKGATFYVNGTVKSTYNKLSSVSCYIYSGYGTNTQAVTGASDTPSGNSYTLKGSAVDDGTWMGPLAVGNYTYVINAGYTNYYAEGATTLKTNSGTVQLVNEYFAVIPSAADQSTCSHTYSSTTLGAADCTQSGTRIDSCTKCGKIVKTAVTSGSHSYGDWTTTEATCTAAGVKVRTCSKCGYQETQTIPAGNHSYGSWSITTKPGCTSEGVQTRVCTKCGGKETQPVSATGHSYHMVYHPANCSMYGAEEYICNSCGHSYKVYEGQWTDWSPEQPPEGLQVETKTQYRYSDYETKTSDAASLSGYTQIGKKWIKKSSGSVQYIESWPAGFDTSSTLYKNYNNKPYTAGETATTKTEVSAGTLLGHIMWHWCSGMYSDGPYNRTTSKTRTDYYNTFNGFATPLSSLDPRTLTHASDGSVTYSYLGVCGDSWWWYYTPIYIQNYTTYTAEFTYERWSDWSEWSDTPIEETSTRKVETRTVYRYKNGELGDHIWEEGTCAVCGEVCNHTFAESVCTNCGYESPLKGFVLFGVINGENYGCEEDFATIGEYFFVDGKLTVTFERSSYVAVKSADNEQWFMTDGWQGFNTTSATLYNALELSMAEKLYVPGGVEVTFTLTENEDGTMTLSYELPPPVLPELKLIGATLSFKDEVYYKIHFTITNPDELTITEMGLLTWTSAIDGTVETAEQVCSGAVNAGEFWIARSQGVPAKKLGDTLYFKVYIKLADGTYVYSQLRYYSARDYAYTMLNDASSTADLKALCVALLNYGAAAQEYFGYNTEALINADVTSSQQELVGQYAESMVGQIVKANPAKTATLPAADGFSYKSASVNFGSAFGINYQFTTTHAAAGAVKLYVWDAATYNEAEALTLENADRVLTMTKLGGRNYQSRVSGIAAKNIGDTVYVMAVYQSGGVTYSTGVLEYSLGAYCKLLAAEAGETQNLAMCTALYGYYAGEYLRNR